MSVDFAIDKNGNFIREDNGFKMTGNNSEYVAQKLQIKLRTFSGEWYLDTAAGIPYLEKMLEKGIDMAFVESIFKSAIYKVKEVKELLSFSIAIDSKTRKLSVKFSVKATDGTIIEGAA